MEENTAWETLCDYEVGQDFLVHKTENEKTNWVTGHQLKNLCSSKQTVKKKRSQRVGKNTLKTWLLIFNT